MTKIAVVVIIVFAALIAQPVTAAEVQALEFGDFALYVPASVSATRGILLALGGPDTRSFISGGPFGAPTPELEASLQKLGQELRTLAADHGLAMLGTSRAALANNSTSDKLIFDAIREAAARSGHSELATVPLFLYGISGGTLQAAGFTARNPERVGALFLKVPAGVESLSSTEALAVPTYIILAERESIVDNKSLVAAFYSNRGTGALWALALEPDVRHHSLTNSHRAITMNWLRAIVKLRLATSAADPVRRVAESSGWLGDPVIGVANWVNYRGDRRSASWFPSKATAEEWKAFVARNQ